MFRRLCLIALTTLAACSEPQTAGETLASEAATPTAASAPSPASLAYVAKVREGWTGGAEVTPEEVINLIGLNGPSGAIGALGADQPGSRWTTVMAGIAGGEAAWLNVAAALEPGVSGTSAQALDSVLKSALAADATATLRVLEPARQRLSPQAVCTGDAEAVAALTPAVQAVTDPVLERKKAACLEAMG